MDHCGILDLNSVIKSLTFDDEVSFGGENNKYIDTIKELIVAIIIPPIVPPNKAAKDIRIRTSKVASSNLLCSIFHLITNALNAVAKAIRIASIGNLRREIMEPLSELN